MGRIVCCRNVMGEEMILVVKAVLTPPVTAGGMTSSRIAGSDVEAFVEVVLSTY